MTSPQKGAISAGIEFPDCIPGDPAPVAGDRLRFCDMTRAQQSCYLGSCFAALRELLNDTLFGIIDLPRQRDGAPSSIDLLPMVVAWLQKLLGHEVAVEPRARLETVTYQGVVVQYWTFEFRTQSLPGAVELHAAAASRTTRCPLPEPELLPLPVLLAQVEAVV